MLEFPLANIPAQRFSSFINGARYEFEISFNSRYGVWTLDIDGDTIDPVYGVVMVAGVDLVSQYALPFKNLYFLNVDEPNQDPVYDNLGSSSKLILLEPGDLDG